MSKIRDYICGRIGLASRKGITETAAILSKSRKRATESKPQAEEVTVTSAREYIQSGDGGGGSSSSWPIPRFAAEAATFAAQVLGFAPKAPPKPSVPGHLVELDQVEDFIETESIKLGCRWRPPLGVILDWHNPMSPFCRPAMGKTVLYDRNPPAVCLDRAGLLELVRFKTAQLLAQPQPEAPPATPPWRPGLAEQAETRAADAAARRTPGQILAAENAAYLAQREQAEAAKVEA